MTDEPTSAWNPTPVAPSSSEGASGAVVGAGVILLVIATLLGIFGILAIFAGAIMGQITNLSGQSGLTEEQANALMTVGRTFIIAFGRVALGLGLAHLLSGIGVLRRRGWARILGLVMSVLGALLGGLAGVLLVLGDHRLLVAGPIGLQQGRADDSRHRVPPRPSGGEMVEGADTLHPRQSASEEGQANSRPLRMSTTTT